ncbi:putative salicylaldehyde dehydrogenase protein [Mycena sanguinolenta]|uniref:Putative salicylaldehyde dehydrogenase protein n=1 Tax=Mycena sanguinolenta TaxID=230812 RepID=A0A8H7DD92_9AGAR|nr:putative salicylaldehyde dehydrogenase protein [Mycena sanguinolenta]
MVYTVPLLINGEEKTSTTTFSVESPSSHATIWSCSSACSADVDAAVAAASAAFPAWSKTKPAQRRNILLKVADLFEERAEELKLHLRQETGSDEMVAAINIVTAAEVIRDIAGRCSAIAGSIPVCQDEGRSALVLKEPYGVVLAIAPWNAPYFAGVRSVLFPLAAGNTCVLKGAELSPRCYYHIGRIFTDAGLPPGALNVLYTPREDSPAITTQLINAPAVRKINFTGSTAVGSHIAAAAGRALKPCLMELGGKAAAIVLEDADLELAAMQCTIGAFVHAGQVCMSTERILVHEAVIDQFRPALQKAVAGFAPPSAPAPVLVQGAAVARNRALVADALAKGATLLHGDHTAEEPHPETGEASSTRLRPIVVEGVTPEMALYRDESFGPTVSVMVVKDEDQAIAITNESEYGLSGAVFTRDLARGLRVAKRLECGNIHINAMSVHEEPNLPSGGVKSSGWGRFNGQWGLEEFVRIKTVTFRE